MRTNLLILLTTTLLVGCAAHDEVRFVEEGEAPVLEFRRKGQLGWNGVAVRRADGVPPARFAVAPPCGTLGWSDGEPSTLNVALSDQLVLFSRGPALFLGDGEAVLLLRDGLALRLLHPNDPVTHERYVGRLPEGGAVELDVWFSAEAPDATLLLTLDGQPVIAADTKGQPATVASSHTRYANGRPVLLETSAPGVKISLTLDATPPTVELVLGEKPAAQVTLARQP